jgi:predicted nucleic acid-binding protein
MTVPYFLDTNILLYAAAGRETAEAKRKRARDLILGARFGTSVQVIQEFYHNATRKIARPLSAARALAWVERLEKLPLVETDRALVRSGIVNSERFRITYWDGAMLAAAQRLGAPVMYSEDLNHGQFYGPVRVIDPFLPALAP